MLSSSFSSLLVLGLLAAAAAAVPQVHAVSVRRTTTAQQRSAGTTARSARITSPNRGETCSRQHQPEREGESPQPRLALRADAGLLV